MNIGLAIKIERTKRRLKQSDLARIVGLSTAYISLVENNKRELSMTSYFKICKALHALPGDVMIAAEEFKLADSDRYAV